MKKKTRLMAVASLGLFLGCASLQAHTATTTVTTTTKGADAQASTTQEEKTEQQVDIKKLSEAFGHYLGRNLKSPGLSLDIDSVIEGIREGAAGKPAPLTEKEFEEMMVAVQEKAFKEMSSSNLKAANDFMEKNRTEAGIIEVVPGKLQYQVLKQGSGATVEPHASPKIHYTGKYQDGTVFGTSEEMGGPITIPLDQTIPGFSKGLVGMKEGEKRRLFVHPDLGYGTTGQLPPNELLIFDIEVAKANSDDAKDKGSAGLSDGTNDEDFFLEEDTFDTSSPASGSTSPSAASGASQANKFQSR